jgi:hypothetical protein
MLPRWKIAYLAKIKWKDAKDYISCEIRDLNMRGFSLEIAKEIPENNVPMELYFNEKYFFNIEVSVAWHKEVDGRQIYGIRFLRIRDADRERIYQMMKENFANHLGKL